MPPGDFGMYGLTLDAHGDPWVGCWEGTLLHFEVETETFESFSLNDRRFRGLQIDRGGSAWIAANMPCGLVRFDTLTRTFVDSNIELPGCAPCRASGPGFA